MVLTPRDAALAQEAAHKAAVDRIAANTYPIRPLFKSRFTGAAAEAMRRNNAANRPDREAEAAALAQNPNAAGALAVANAATAARANLPNAEQMKAKYGEITMLDFPTFTKETFPGVTRMDLFSGLFGDVTDETMYFPAVNGRPGGFDPLSAVGPEVAGEAGRRPREDRHEGPAHLQQRAVEPGRIRIARGRRQAQGGRRDGQALAEGLRGAGREVHAHELAAGAGPQHPPQRDRARARRRLPAQHRRRAAAGRGHRVAQGDGRLGGDLGIKVTIENHWGLAADPTNIRIILDEVNHPYCEASPDFGNWEFDYMLVHGLKALAPYASSNVHAKYWDRWGDKNDVQRSTRIMLAAGFKGTFALEYEQGPLNGVEGAKYLYKEVLTALTTPTPVIG